MIRKSKKDEEWSDEAIENFVELINLLRDLEEEQINMTEEEKRDNAVKMHTDKGDIYY